MDSARDQIIEKTKELMDLVRHTDAYREYHASLLEIRKMDGLYEKMNEFRHRNMMVNFIEDPDEKSMEIDRIYKEYEEILIDPLTSRFLSGEQKICRLMQKIYETIGEQIDLDLEHLYSDS